MARARGMQLGIGDDCAIYRPRANEDLLFTADQMIEGVHFLRDHAAQAVGQRALARGDLSHAEKIYCDVMVCGSVARGKALRRDTARPGDFVYVSGRLGKPWDRPIEPRLALGRELIGRATSCIDLSDGLS